MGWHPAFLPLQSFHQLNFNWWWHDLWKTRCLHTQPCCSPGISINYNAEFSMTSFTLHVPNPITKWKTKFSCQVIRNKLRVQGRNKQTLRADSRGSCSPVAHVLSSSPAFCARTAALLHWISRGRCTRQRTLEHTVMFKYTYTHMFRYTFTHDQVGIHTSR